MPEATSVSAQNAPEKKMPVDGVVDGVVEQSPKNDACNPHPEMPGHPPSENAPQNAPDPMGKLKEMFGNPQALTEMLTDPEAAARKMLGPETIAKLEQEKAEYERQGLENKAALENMAVALDKRLNELIDHHRCLEGMIAGLQNLLIGEKKILELIERLERRAEKGKGK